LGLFRACLKDTQQVLDKDDTNGKAILLQVEANIGLGKQSVAKDIANDWISKNIVQDVDIFQRINEIIHESNGLPKDAQKLTQQVRDNNTTVRATLNGDTKQTKRVSSHLDADIDISSRQTAFTLAGESANISLNTKSSGQSTEQLQKVIFENDSIDYTKTPVNKLISIGYYKVNTGMLKDSIDHFTRMIEAHPTVVQAYLGRGTAYALQRQLDDAILDFSKSISIEPTNNDAWKRRGQARAARGYVEDALKDMTEATRLAPDDAEGFHQRGALFYNLKAFSRAIQDFTRASECDPTDIASLSFLGLCLNSNGRCLEAAKVFEKVTKIDSNHREAWCNMAQAYRDWGDIDNAEKCFKVAIEEITGGKPYDNAYYLRSLLRYCSGNLKGALKDATRGCERLPKDKNMIHMKALSLHALGQFHDAVQAYNLLVQLAPTFYGYHQREIAIHVHSLLDTPLSRINFDNEFDRPFKEAWSKRLDPAILKKKTNYKDKQFNSEITDVNTHPSLSDDEMAILRYSAPFGARLQLKTPGFLPNKRQHRMCGLAVLEMAQVSKSHNAQLIIIVRTELLGRA
jgi:tetratricopeptide (TPR) repeat protein